MRQCSGWLGSVILLTAAATARGQRQSTEPPLLQTRALVPTSSTRPFIYDSLGISQDEPLRAIQNAVVEQKTPVEQETSNNKKAPPSWSLCDWFCSLVHHVFGPDPQVLQVASGRRRYPDQSTGLGKERPELWPPAHDSQPARAIRESKSPAPIAPALASAPEVLPLASGIVRQPDEARRRETFPSLLVSASMTEPRERTAQGMSKPSPLTPWEGPVLLPALLTVADLRPCPAMLVNIGAEPALVAQVVQVMPANAPTPTIDPLFKSPAAPAFEPTLLARQVDKPGQRPLRPQSPELVVQRSGRSNLLLWLLGALGLSLLAAGALWGWRRRETYGEDCDLR